MIRLGVLGALVGAPLPAVMAGSAGTTMPIQASVAPVCVVSATTLNFGTYDPIVTNAAAPLDVNGSITVRCLRNSTYSVTLDAGLNSAGGLRNMKEPGGTLLNYELYADSGRTTVWNTTNTVSGVAPSSAPIALTVYGRIPPAQNVVAATYNDTVAVTVNF